jgi:hypothetical protein
MLMIPLGIGTRTLPILLFKVPQAVEWRAVCLSTKGTYFVPDRIAVVVMAAG